MSNRFTYNGSYPSFVSAYSIAFDGVVDNLFGVGSLADYSFVQNTGVFSVGAWVKMDDHTLTTLNMIMANLVGSSAKGFLFSYDNRTGGKFLRMSINRGTGNIVAFASANNSITDNNWHWVEAKGNGTTATFYVDTVAKGTSAAFGTLSTGNSTFNLMIGREPQLNLFPLMGRIHRTAIWDIELTAGESTSAYNTPDLTSLSTDGNLKSYLRMTNNGGVMNGGLGVNIGNRIFDMKGGNFGTPSPAMTDALNKVADTPYP